MIASRCFRGFSSTFLKHLSAECLFFRFIRQYFSSWIIRIYTDFKAEEIPSEMCQILCQYSNIDLCFVDNLPILGDCSKTFGMLWRYWCLGDSLVDVVLFRDMDSLVRLLIWHSENVLR